jgi:ATP synthase protein I
MPEPDESSEQALKRLDDELEAFQASRKASPPPLGLGGSASEGFRLLGQILGGVLGGLGLGWLVDRLAGTAPIGVLAGLLIGTVLSIVAAVRQASLMSAKAATESPPASAPEDDQAQPGEE